MDEARTEGFNTSVYTGVTLQSILANHLDSQMSMSSSSLSASIAFLHPLYVDSIQKIVLVRVSTTEINTMTKGKLGKEGFT